MNTQKYTVTPFHPCNDRDRAAGVVAGWDVRDENHVTVECFDDESEARTRCAEMNGQTVMVGDASAFAAVERPAVSATEDR